MPFKRTKKSTVTIKRTVKQPFSQAANRLFEQIEQPTAGAGLMTNQQENANFPTQFKFCYTNKCFIQKVCK